MSYDPLKEETWIVNSKGFWKKGDIKGDENSFLVTCNWRTVKFIQQQLNSMIIQQSLQRRALEEHHRIAIDKFKEDAQAIWPEKD